MKEQYSTLGIIGTIFEIDQNNFCSRGGILETSSLGPFAAGIFYKCSRRCPDCKGEFKKTNFIDMAKGGGYSEFSPIK